MGHVHPMAWWCSWFGRESALPSCLTLFKISDTENHTLAHMPTILILWRVVGKSNHLCTTPIYLFFTYSHRKLQFLVMHTLPMCARSFDFERCRKWQIISNWKATNDNFHVQDPNTLTHTNRHSRRYFFFLLTLKQISIHSMRWWFLLRFEIKHIIFMPQMDFHQTCIRT